VGWRYSEWACFQLDVDVTGVLKGKVFHKILPYPKTWHGAGFELLIENSKKGAIIRNQVVQSPFLAIDFIICLTPTANHNTLNEIAHAATEAISCKTLAPYDNSLPGCFFVSWHLYQDKAPGRSPAGLQPVPFHSKGVRFFFSQNRHSKIFYLTL
jgi:hypothetical protein